MAALKSIEKIFSWGRWIRFKFKKSISPSDGWVYMVGSTIQQEKGYLKRSRFRCSVKWYQMTFIRVHLKKIEAMLSS